LKSWPYLCEEIAHAIRCRSAVLDGEIVCLEPDAAHTCIFVIACAL
jgi:ATP-dependent DNA ligase